MNSLLQVFVKRLLFFTAFLAASGLLLFQLLPRNFITPALPFLLLFFMAVTMIGYYLLLKASSKTLLKFLNAFLLLTFGKLILFIGVLVLYILLNRWDAMPFGIGFFVLYLFYTAFEVVYLVKISKSLHS